MSGRPLTRLIRRAAVGLALFAIFSGPIGRAVVRLIYWSPPGSRVSVLIAGGVRDRGIDEYINLLAPLTFTLSIWAILPALLLGLATFESPGLWRRLSTVNPVVILTGVYALAWGLLLLSAPGVFWDDWTFYGKPWSEAYRLHAEGGRPLNLIYELLIRGVGTTAVSVISLIIHLLIGLGFFQVLERANHGSRGERLMAAAILLAAPLNAARNTYAVFQYTFSLGLLVAAWYLLIRRSTGPNRADVQVSAVILLLAAFTPSVALFSYVVLGHIALVLRARTRSRDRIRALAPLLPIPAVIVAVDQFVLVPSGAMEAYNTVDVRTLLAWGLITLVFAITTSLVAAVRCRKPAWRPGVVQFLLPVLLGITLVALSLLPYAVVGRDPKLRFPPFGLMGTRHELLVGFGVAVLVVGLFRGVSRIAGPHATNVTAVALIVVLIMQSSVVSLSYWVEYRKQAQFMAHVAQISAPEALARASTVLIVDQTTDCNALTRNIRDDEWAAQITLMQPGFNGRVILGTDREEVRHDIDVVLTLRNRRGRCEVASGLVPLWSYAGLPRLIRLPELIIRRPDLDVIVWPAG